jgi:hypothetical protein
MQQFPDQRPSRTGITGQGACSQPDFGEPKSKKESKGPKNAAFRRSPRLMKKLSTNTLRCLDATPLVFQ